MYHTTVVGVHLSGWVSPPGLPLTPSLYSYLFRDSSCGQTVGTILTLY